MQQKILMKIAIIDVDETIIKLHMISAVLPKESGARISKGSIEARDNRIIDTV